jgi:lipid A ethanolaminephosphotransferase
MITTGCILSPHGRDDWEKEPVEPLPSYLHRLGIKTFVRTNNTEMPRLKVGDYKTTSELAELCKTDNCKAYNARSCENQLCQESYFDNMLLANMDPILDLAQQEKVFLLLHLRGSHGPNYADRSPKEFRPFTPACDDHVTKCSLETLTNSYDNSTAFTDQVLANLATKIAQRQNLDAAILYLSDHGQSLGEDGLYMHGLPIDEAPIEQLEIPFLLWTSETLKKVHDISKVINTNVAAQDAIFHSVLGLFNVIDGPYDPQRDIFRVR